MTRRAPRCDRAGRAVVVVIAVIAVALAVAAVAVILSAGGDGERSAEAIERNNRAVGLMGRYDYEQARQIFAALSDEDPEWLDVRVNLAIATLNRQQEDDTEAALAMLEQVIERDATNLRAQYCAGLLQLYLGSPGTALDRFRLVADADPTDAYVAYYVAACLAQQQQYEEAVTWYEKARDLDPYLQSAYYGLAQTYQRLGRTEESEAMARDFERLRSNPRARLVDFRYTRMGPKADTLAVDHAEPPVVGTTDGPLFETPRAMWDGVVGNRGIVLALERRPAGITTVDVDGNGRLDVFIAGRGAGRAAGGGEGAVNLLLLQDAAGEFAAALDHPLAMIDAVNAALWGDVDNDGLVDVFLCRTGTNALWRQSANGVWEDVTETALPAGPALATVDGAIFDADHDGDLDVFCVNADGPDRLLSNNLDGTFRDIAPDSGLDGGDRPSRQVLVGDLDADRDLDIVVIHDDPPHGAYLNDRLWAYRVADDLDELATAAGIAAACVADTDADGRPSIGTLSADGLVREWSAGPDGRWRPRTVFTVANQGGVPPDAPQLAAIDLDGDMSTLEWVVSQRFGWLAADHAGVTIARGDAGEGALWTPVVLEAGRGPAVVAADMTGSPVLWPAGPGRRAFVDLTFSGREDRADGMRSNASGIGARVAARAGSHWTVFTTIRATSGPGQSLQPWPVGLAGRPALDFVSIEWPDGVLQTEVHGVAAAADQPDRDFSARRLERIDEIQRQKSSCPVIFAWDGERYVFVTDALGVGGLGYLVAPGEYGAPRPWERLPLPAGLPAPRDGRYELKVTEPMEEACYLDAARLVAWDLPPGWNVVTDDRMAILGPEPTGEAIHYRHEVLPRRAVNDRGDDVTALVVEVDLRAAPVGALDHRFIGRLEREHALELEFAAPLDELPGAPVLVVDGWVEYPYSQTMFAAWQAGADYAAPTLEAAGPDGPWVVVLEQFGYPAGMPRRMAVPLTGLPPGTTRLRLRTNQEIYWDRVAVAGAEACPEARRHELTLRAATMRASGFAVRTTGPQRLPHYDYARRPTFWDTRHQRGMYTAFGPVEPLVSATDDAVAIIGPGEEVHLAFAVPADPPPPGWSRRLVLELDGWCKDMDLYTRDGDTLAPLPSRGASSAEVEALHRRFNTRYLEGY